jgi:hypothetical protein
VLTNLRKAQQAGEIPLFVVRPGKSELDWAKRVEGILSPPVRELQNGEIRFYTDDSPITFNGGATEEGGVTAIRPVTGSDDNRRSIWVREDDSIVLYDGAGTEHVRLASLSAVTKDRVPAIYSYDHAANEYLVYEPGETHTYESKAAFDEAWVPIKIPFVPEDCLPEPAFGSDSYCIVILPADAEPVVYTDGVTNPLDTLLETSFTTVKPEPTSGAARSSDGEQDSGSTTPEETPHEQPATPTQESIWKDDPDAAIGQFASQWIVEDEGGVATSAEVYELYQTWAKKHDLEPDSKSWFGRRLNNQISFERTTERQNGTPVRCYEGIRLRQRVVDDE